MNPIVGKWQLKTNFVNATFEISEKDSIFSGRVLSYNDGTTIQNEPQSDYFFTGVASKGGKYTPGVIYPNTAMPGRIQFELKGDELNVTKFMMNRPETEIWTKLK